MFSDLNFGFVLICAISDIIVEVLLLIALPKNLISELPNHFDKFSLFLIYKIIFLHLSQ
jgi:hypothetical protein